MQWGLKRQLASGLTHDHFHPLIPKQSQTMNTLRSTTLVGMTFIPILLSGCGRGEVNVPVSFDVKAVSPNGKMWTSLDGEWMVEASMGSQSQSIKVKCSSEIVYALSVGQSGDRFIGAVSSSSNSRQKVDTIMCCNERSVQVAILCPVGHREKAVSAGHREKAVLQIDLVPGGHVTVIPGGEVILEDAKMLSK